MHIRQNHGTYPPDGWHLLTFLQVLVRLNLGLHLFVQRCALLVHFGLDTAGVRNRCLMKQLLHRLLIILTKFRLLHVSKPCSVPKYGFH